MPGELSEVSLNLVISAQNLADAALSGVRAALESFTSTTTQVSASFREMERQVNASLRAVWDDIKRVFKNVLKDALDFGKNFVEMIAHGIKGAIGSITSAVSTVASKMKDYLGFHSPTKEGPASESDVWAPNLMKMMAQGIVQHTPLVRSVLHGVFDMPQEMIALHPNTSTMGRPMTSNSYHTEPVDGRMGSLAPAMAGNVYVTNHINVAGNIDHDLYDNIMKRQVNDTLTTLYAKGVRRP